MGAPVLEEADVEFTMGPKTVTFFPRYLGAFVYSMASLKMFDLKSYGLNCLDPPLTNLAKVIGNRDCVDDSALSSDSKEETPSGTVDGFTTSQ